MVYGIAHLVWPAGLFVLKPTVKKCRAVEWCLKANLKQATKSTRDRDAHTERERKREREGAEEGTRGVLPVYLLSFFLSNRWATMQIAVCC